MRFKVTILMVLVVISVTLVASVAAAPFALSPPNRPTVAATSNPGELQVSWNGIADAEHYTIGYANLDELNQMAASGRNALDAFYYVTIGAPYTIHTLAGLKPGTDYYVLIGAQTERFGATDLVWGPWSDAITTTAAPAVSSCLVEETCLPIEPIGTFHGVGNTVDHTFGLEAGVYRFTASRNNTDGIFFIAVIELDSGEDSSVGIYGSSESGGQEALTIYNDGLSYHLQEGNYLLDVDTEHAWSVEVEQIAAH